MKSLARFAALCLLALCAASALASNPFYKADDTTVVELSGTFGVDVGLDANDVEEHYYYVKLDQPIDVDDVTDPDPEYVRHETNITKIQLALDGDERFSSKAYKGKRVTIKGALYGSHSAHHHTRILMSLKQSDLRLVAP